MTFTNPQTSEESLKRVIALPGDTVAHRRGRARERAPVDEPYVDFSDWEASSVLAIAGARGPGLPPRRQPGRLRGLPRLRPRPGRGLDGRVLVAAVAAGAARRRVAAAAAPLTDNAEGRRRPQPPPPFGASSAGRDALRLTPVRRAGTSATNAQAGAPAAPRPRRCAAPAGPRRPGSHQRRAPPVTRSWRSAVSTTDSADESMNTTSCRSSTTVAPGLTAAEQARSQLGHGRQIELSARGEHRRGGVRTGGVFGHGGLLVGASPS